MSSNPNNRRPRATRRGRRGHTARNADLHGNVPDSSPAALILIDLINDLEFEGGENLLRAALKARPSARLDLAKLRRR